MVEILPAWLIDAIEKMEKERQEIDRPRVYIEPPRQMPPIHSNNEENREVVVFIPLF